MKPCFGLVRCVGLIITPLLSVRLLAGCASMLKVDWNTRVGNFTFDQAVAELGPPDKSTKLSDGSTVADWITGKPSGPPFGLGLGSTGYRNYETGTATRTSVGMAMPFEGYSASVLRLKFGSDGKLVEWSRSQ